MDVGVKILIYEAIVFYLSYTSADRFLEQHPSCVFFIGQQFVECLPVPFGLASGGADVFASKADAIFPKLSPWR